MSVDCRLKAIILLRVLNPLFKDISICSYRSDEGDEVEFYARITDLSIKLVGYLREGGCDERILKELLVLIRGSSFEASYLEMIESPEFTSTVRKLLLDEEAEDVYEYFEKRLNEAYRRLTDHHVKVRE